MVKERRYWRYIMTKSNRIRESGHSRNNHYTIKLHTDNIRYKSNRHCHHLSPTRHPLHHLTPIRHTLHHIKNITPCGMTHKHTQFSMSIILIQFTTMLTFQDGMIKTNEQSILKAHFRPFLILGLIPASSHHTNLKHIAPSVTNKTHITPSDTTQTHIRLSVVIENELRRFPFLAYTEWP